MKILLHTLIFFIACINTMVYSQELIDKVSIKLIDHLIFIEISVNDSIKPLNFMFDTGAGITVIDSKIAEQLHLNISGKLKIGTSGKTLISEQSSPNTLKIGKKLVLDNITLALMDLSHLSKYLKYNVDGIIGYDLLKATITETNIDTLIMRFFSTNNYVYTGNTSPSQLIGLESNHLGLPIEIVPKGSKKSLMLTIKIDTGAANYLTLHNGTVNEHNLINSNKKYKPRKGFGADSTITNNINSKVSMAIFGGKKWKNIPVVFEIDPLNKISNKQADGLIGQKMLLDFNITYNLKDEIVYLEKRK